MQIVFFGNLLALSASLCFATVFFGGGGRQSEIVEQIVPDTIDRLILESCRWSSDEA